MVSKNACFTGKAALGRESRIGVWGVVIWVMAEPVDVDETERTAACVENDFLGELARPVVRRIEAIVAKRKP
jgi:hypothetical protein